MSLGSLFSGRSDSTVHLRAADFRVSEDFIWLRLTEKGKRHTAIRRVVRLPLRSAPVEGCASALPRVALLARRFLLARRLAWQHARLPEPEWLFQLPAEARPTTRSMESWFRAVMHRLDISAPDGFVYLAHSIRSGAASAESAIGVPRPIYVWMGGWRRSSPVVERHYVDPTVLPSPAAYRLFGWMLSRQYEVGVGEIVHQRLLPDPRLEDISEDA